MCRQFSKHPLQHAFDFQHIPADCRVAAFWWCLFNETYSGTFCWLQILFASFAHKELPLRPPLIRLVKRIDGSVRTSLGPIRCTERETSSSLISPTEHQRKQTELRCTECIHTLAPLLSHAAHSFLSVLAHHAHLLELCTVCVCVYCVCTLCWPSTESRAFVVHHVALVWDVAGLRSHTTAKVEFPSETIRQRSTSTGLNTWFYYCTEFQSVASLNAV